MDEQAFSAGHLFFQPGDPGDRAYLVHSGQVEILAGPPDGYRRLNVIGPDEVFGEMSLVEERPRALTARAVTDGRVTPLTRDDFERQLIADPPRCRHYLRSLFEKLRTLSARLAEMGPAAGDTHLPADPSGEAAPHVGPYELPTGDQGQSLPDGWSVVLLPLTRQAAKTLPDEGIRITRVPFRIGRTAGAREPESLDLNDVWLIDSKPFSVSRNHCEIALSKNGLIARDRGSHLGCLVNDTPIGGKAVLGYAKLEEGDNVLILGGRMSPYQFRVTVSMTTK
ncbi:MAG TPA: cyclic nucleotide-binding domain-containing protein [Fimbriiglobus sp.]|jgi:CRP-like cAMP-binding protein